jgi:predicted DNA-binding transcriptional regulator YafY
MSLINYINRISAIDCLIQSKATGTAQQLAKLMQLTEPQLRRHIKTMKQMGFPIKYSRRDNSYCYQPGV